MEPTITPVTDAGAQAAPPAAPVQPAAPDVRGAALAVLNGHALPGSEPAPAAEVKTEPAADPAKAPEPKVPERDPWVLLAKEKAARVRTEREAKATAEAAKKFVDVKDPIAALVAHGFTYEQATEAILRQGEPPKTDDKLADLEKRIADREAADAKANDERQTQAQRQQYDAGLGVVRERITAAADKYPTITALGEHEAVYQTLGAYAQKHELGPEDITLEVLDAVAAAYEAQRLEEEGERIGRLVAKVPRLAERWAPPTQVQPGQRTDSGAQGTSAPTLASREISAAPPPGDPKRGYSQQELREITRKVLMGEMAPPV